MTSTKIWMPLYIGDYLADTTRLTTEQHGAYLLLIMDYWRNGSPPDNDAVLAQITRMSPDAWSNAKSTVEAFFEHRDGHLYHTRIELEKASSVTKKEAASAKAAAAAAKRWGKNASCNAPGNNEAMPEQCPSPSPSHSYSNTNVLLVPSLPADDQPPAIPEELKTDECPHQEIIALYHEILPECSRVRIWNSARRAVLRQRWKEDQKRQNLDWWRRFFSYVAKSDWLTGRCEPTPGRVQFVADLEWLVRSGNFVKVIEGKYNPEKAVA